MVRFVGFFLPLLRGSLRGDVGAEKGCDDSTAPAVAGRRSGGGFMSRVSFFTFLVVSCTLCASSVTMEEVWLSVRAMASFPWVDIATLPKAVAGTVEVADSGDEVADVSETKGESKVELVVVGEDSEDSENKEGMLPRWAKGLLWCWGSSFAAG